MVQTITTILNDGNSSNTVSANNKVTDLIERTCKLVPSMKKVVRVNDNERVRQLKTAIFLASDKIEANYRRQGLWYPGTISAVGAVNDTYDVTYDDGEHEKGVHANDIRRRIDLPSTHSDTHNKNNNNDDDDDDTIYTEIEDDDDRIKTSERQKKRTKKKS